jgi:RNA polymerase sigma factor (sigma-70 family)
MSAASSFCPCKTYPIRSRRSRGSFYLPPTGRRACRQHKRPQNKSDSDGSADNGCLHSGIIKAGFTEFYSKPGLFLAFRHFPKCRSPPTTLRFWTKNSKMEDKSMAEEKKYPILFDHKIYWVEKALYDEYYRSQRKIKYFEQDLKSEHIIVDEGKQKAFFIPSREDSYERLFGDDLIIPDNYEKIENMVERVMNKEKLKSAISMLSPEEKMLIQEIYYENKYEYESALELGISQAAIHKRKVKILKKLKKFMEN